MSSSLTGGTDPFRDGASGTRLSEAQLVEARTKAETLRIDAQAKAEARRVEAAAEGERQRLTAEADAEAERIRTTAEVDALRQREQVAHVYTASPAPLRLRELPQQ